MDASDDVRDEDVVVNMNEEEEEEENGEDEEVVEEVEDEYGEVIGGEEPERGKCEGTDGHDERVDGVCEDPTDKQDFEREDEDEDEEEQ